MLQASAEAWIKSKLSGVIEPRQYQLEAWNALYSARRNGQDKALVQLATGLGKTLVAAVDVSRYIDEENPLARVLFVSHVTDISDQAKQTFEFVDKAVAGDCIFTTFQWLYANPDTYAADWFDYVVYDEAHHSEADSFKQVRDYFKPRFALALTATPERADGRDITDYFGSSLYSKPLAEGIAEGWLSPVDYHLVLDDTLKKAIKGNFEVGSLSELRALFKLRIRDESIANEVKQRQEAIGLADAQTIVFCNSIENAQHIAGILGGKAYYADLHPIERAQTLKEFRDGSLKTICTIDMFNEGIDIPNARLIVFLRSTSSRTIFEQQLGRGLRRAPGKTHVTVLDFAANIERIGFTRDLGHTISKLRGVAEGYSGLNTGDRTGRSNALFDFGTTFDFDDIAVDILDKYLVLSDRTHLSREAVIAAYNQTKSISQVAEQFGVSWNAVYKHLQAAGIDSSIHKARTMKTEAMIAAYQELGSVKKVSEKLGIATDTIRYRLRKVGFEISYPSQKKYASPELIEAFTRLGSIRQAALETGIDRTAARQRLLNSGIDTSKGKRRHKKQKSLQTARGGVEASN